MIIISANTQWSTGCERGTGADAVHTHTQRLQWAVNGAGRAAVAGASSLSACARDPEEGHSVLVFTGFEMRIREWGVVGHGWGEGDAERARHVPLHVGEPKRMPPDGPLPPTGVTMTDPRDVPESRGYDRCGACVRRAYCLTGPRVPAPARRRVRTRGPSFRLKHLRCLLCDRP